LAKNVLGEKAEKLILNKLARKGENNILGRDIVFVFTDEIQNIYGLKGGQAIVRQLGRELAKVLMEKYPKEQWEEILDKGLNEFIYADKVEINKDEACICNCAFYEDVLKPKNLKPTEHCVCWLSWGFIEGFVKNLEEGVRGVQWVDRDYENKKCKFAYVRE